MGEIILEILGNIVDLSFGSQTELPTEPFKDLLGESF